MSQDRLSVLGIRHHGPGSAASLLAALDALDPAAVLIEGPPEADGIIAYAGHEEMRPPVALLIYQQDDPSRSVFYPFAEFSPEWQAMRWALKQGRPVRFIDLPAAVRLAPEDESTAPDPPDEVRRDPLTALAEIAGESDGESWWNAIVEQSASGPGVFQAIAGAMAALRAAQEEEQPLSPREAQREAHMRREIARTLESSEGHVAVVCGAWHVPALTKKVSAAADAKLLKGLPRVKTSATWVPWTSSRLAAASGYGAGVISPGWYQHLWSGGERSALRLTARWQGQVAGLLRAEGLPAATASVIEASRLALSLAALRGYPLPGLAEMQDASLAVLCHGDGLLLRLIERKLVIGDGIGEVGSAIPQMPLAEDLQRWQKKLRLKPLPVEEEMAVDLRSEAGLAKSTLFNRLLIIGVPWGRLFQAQAGRGTFREVWRVAWQPELSVKLAEALRYGATIAQAAANAALDAGQQTQSIARVAEFIGLCLRADLPEAAEVLTARLQALSVSHGDVVQLMRAAVPLIQVLRYGTARRMPREALAALVSGLSAEICAGLSSAAMGLGEEAAAQMLSAMQDYDAAVPLLEAAHHRDAWLDALYALEEAGKASPFLRGFALRRLYDTQRRGTEETSLRLSRALSPAVPVQEAGQWLEGFLHQAAQLLLNDPLLFAAVDQWMAELSEESFVEMLPVLRRAVSSFDRMERRHILEQVRRGDGAAAHQNASAADPRSCSAAFRKALPLLCTILGLDPDDPKL